MADSPNVLNILFSFLFFFFILPFQSSALYNRKLCFSSHASLFSFLQTICYFPYSLISLTVVSGSPLLSWCTCWGMMEQCSPRFITSSLSLTNTHTRTHSHFLCNAQLMHHLHTDQHSGPTWLIFRTKNRQGSRHISTLELRSTFTPSPERALNNQQRVFLQPPVGTQRGELIFVTA